MSTQDAQKRAIQAIDQMLEAETVQEMNTAVDNAKALVAEHVPIDYETMSMLIDIVRTTEGAL